MNEREKKLAIIMLVALLVAAGIFGVQMLDGASGDGEKKISSLRADIAKRQTILEQAPEWLEFNDWLESNKPKPSTVMDQRDSLLNDARNTAVKNKLEVSSLKPPQYLEPNTESPEYHRARIAMNFTCTDENLYKWLCEMNDPAKFRAVTMLKLTPNRQDNTKMDAEVQLEEWVVPNEQALNQ